MSVRHHIMIYSHNNCAKQVFTRGTKRPGHCLGALCDAATPFGRETHLEGVELLVRCGALVREHQALALLVHLNQLQSDRLPDELLLRRGLNR